MTTACRGTAKKNAPIVPGKEFHMPRAQGYSGRLALASETGDNMPSTPTNSDTIENRFGFHPATPETREKHQQIRENFIWIANNLDSLLPASREKSLALTALQEASMWSNAAVACGLAPLKLGE